MPVVISLLNSFTGTAAAMAGFVLGNPVLIISGALVGASGAILTKLMADAMNRSVMNIMIGGFDGGDEAAGAAAGAGGTVREIGADDVAIQLAYAQHVIIVPGYGLAVAQAQHAIKEVGDELPNGGSALFLQLKPHTDTGLLVGALGQFHGRVKQTSLDDEIEKAIDASMS
jgi:NAD(P) transhydrogenase subunit beta